MPTRWIRYAFFTTSPMLPDLELAVVVCLMWGDWRKRCIALV